MRTVVAAGLAVALLASGAVAAGPDFDKMGAQAYAPSRPAPAFTLPDLDGRPHTLNELRGKVVMLYFWATW